MPRASESHHGQAARGRSAPVRRLNWGCGSHVGDGWINSDIKEAPEIDLVADIKKGLPLDANSIDYAVSVHALPELSYSDLIPALGEIRRVLKPAGVLRLVLPDLRRAIDAYMAGDDRYFHLVAKDTTTPGGRLITQMLWYGYSRTLFTADFSAELLQKAGYVNIVLCEAHQTASEFPEIVELDNREAESFYVEATKPGHRPRPFWRVYNGRSTMMTTSEVLDVSLTGQGGDGEDLEAAHLDGPVAGMRVEDGPLRVVGWVVGDRARVREIEVVSDHKVIGKAPVDVPRPGVAEQFAGVAGADTAGFDLKLQPSGRGVSELLVTAVFDDGSRSAIGTIRVDVTRRGMLSRLFG
jgi:predicted SAM-dependent methyltransferase